MPPPPTTSVRAVRRGWALLATVGVVLIVADIAATTAGLSHSAPAAPGCGLRAAVAGGRALMRQPIGGGPAALLGTVPGLAHPAVSPDGRLIAFLSHSNGIVARLQVCDLARRTMHPIPMSIPAGDFPLSWSTSGKTLLFLGGDLLGWGADQRPFVVRVTGSGLRQLAGTAPWYYDGAELSPDGSRLALLLQWKYPHGREPEQLAVLDLRTGKLERVAGSAQVAEIDAITWAPDGRTLALSAYRPNARGSLYLVDVRTKRLTPVLVRGPGAVDPAWSPDGRSLAFVRRSGRRHSIWLLDLRSKRTQQVTHGGDDLSPTWTPDGKALVFVRRAGA